MVITDANFCVNTWIYGGVTLAEVARRAAIGFDGVELVGEPQEFRPAEVRCTLADAGLRALDDISYEGVVSLEPLPRGASPYDARGGHIPGQNWTPNCAPA